MIMLLATPLIITFPKSTIETLEKCVMYVPSQQKYQKEVNDFGLVSELLTLNIFNTFF